MKQSRLYHRQSQAALVEKYRMIGESEAFLDCMQRVSRAAKVNRPVLIIGERGTGKELVAARLHFLSPRWQQPKIAINCAAFPPELLEAEIFGYEQGAFTGAVRTKPGRFELANGGSLFLDELAQSPMALQEKILRVLEYQEFERVGGTETLRVDVRVIAATNQDLPTLCKQGKFRDDLLDRLSFEVITLPPLRARREDIPLLARVFALKMARELDLPQAPRFRKETLDAMLAYDWPGNIRELKNLVERAVYHHPGEEIDDVIFDPFASPFRPLEPGAEPRTHPVAAPQPETPEVTTGNLPEAIEQLERTMVTTMLKKHQFNQKKTAEDLGVSYYQLRRILKRLDLP